VSWAEPAGSDSFQVTCFDDRLDHGIQVTLAPPPGPPGQRARWMADYLLSRPAEDWPIVRRFRRDDAGVSAETPASRDDQA
jgi:hypothetical protein